MKNFDYIRPETAAEARDAAARPGARLLAGGTTLVDLARAGAETPDLVVDISRLAAAEPRLGAIEALEGEGGSGGETLRLGALVTMARAEADPTLRLAAPAVAQSLALAASPQIRNMATLGGNLLQRTRCPYFRDPAAFPSCNKRAPGSGCSALGGPWKGRAALGATASCVAAYPGDLAAALVAFDAVVEIAGPEGVRDLPVAGLFLTPLDAGSAARDTGLAPGEMIEGIRLPASAAAARSTYLKIRDRASYEFATVGVAAGLDLGPDGTVRDARIALTGVAPVPLRARAAEAALLGAPLTEEAAARAGRLAFAPDPAGPDSDAPDPGAARFKLTLGPRVVARALLTLGGLA
ncbi:MAG: FAD binding domain-containing protein [Pseudomonadota bacterium]|nr:FAD binding domain-containing protein [Pseudomonadota bacterium]